MASELYNSAKAKLGAGLIDWDSDTIKVALLKDTYTPDIDADVFWDDVSTHEVSASGSYPAGGITLTTSVTQDDANDRAIYDAADAQATTFSGTFKWLVVYKDTGTPSTSPLICYLEADPVGSANVIVLTGTLDITWNADGVFNLT